MSRKTNSADGTGRPRSSLGRVLVVEDDPIQGMALEEGPADAIVLDVHLADRDDGWALAELVDLLGPRRPRIVFSTGSPEDIPPEIAEMGPVFEKPYDPAQLAAALASGARPGLFARLRNAIG